MTHTPTNIIVRTPNWVGDAVMSFPFLASLRATFPSARITCLARPRLTSLFADLSHVDDVIAWDESSGRHGLASVRANAKNLRPRNFDTAISLPASFGSALMFWLAGIPVRVGHAAEGRRLLLTASVPFGRNGRRPHRTEGYLQLLSLLTPNPVLHRQLAYAPGQEARERAHSLWTQIPSPPATPVLALAPQAAQPNKMWLPERFAGIARRWIDATGGSVILTGGPEDREPCAALLADIQRPSAVNFAGSGDLPTTAALIARCDFLCGNDSGLVHLAAAVGIPVVVISGPGDPAEVAPFTPNAITVKHPLFCSPCYKNTCWRKDIPIECLTSIGIDEVWQHILTLHRRHTSSA